MKPFFSIIIPTLNEEKYLPRLLESLTRQTFNDFEVAVVDGQSEDKTVPAAREWGEKLNKKKVPLRIIPSDKRNVSCQRNLGAKDASGKYFIFFDADVTIGREFLKKIFQHIKKEESVFLTTWVEPDTKETIDEVGVLLTNYLIELTRHTPRPILPGYNIIVERNIFRVIGGFDEKVVHAEDLYLAQKARKKGILLHFLKEPVLTMSLRRLRREGRLRVLRKYSNALTHILFKGPITKDIFDYPMGGSDSLPYKKESLLEKLKKKFS